MRYLIPLIFCFVFISFSNDAYADGCMVVPVGYDNVREPEQRAFIKLENGMETIVLHVRTETDSPEIGWVIPLPSYPEVTEADPALFAELQKLTKPKRKRNWSILPHGAMENKTMRGYVQVETDIVGMYEVNRIRSNNAESLFQWLNENNFRQPYGARGVLRNYIDRRFCFLAIRVTMQGMDEWNRRQGYRHQNLRSGWLDPIRIEFRSRNYFYPMRISSINRGPVDLELWVLAKGYMSFEDAKFVAGKWVDRGMLAENYYMQLLREVSGTMYITRLRRSWSDSGEIYSDIYLKPKFRLGDAFNANWWKNR